MDLQCSYYHCLALVKGFPFDIFGTVYGWGHNDYGQISGESSTSFTFTPIKALSSFYDGKIKKIGALRESSFAITYEGNMLYWGINNTDITSFNITNGLRAEMGNQLQAGGPNQVSPPPGGTFERFISSAEALLYVMAKKKDDQLDRIAKREERKEREEVALVSEYPMSVIGFVQMSFSNIDCPQPPPVDPATLPPGLNLTCSWVSPTQKVWLVVGNLQLTPSSPLVVSGPLTIQGDLVENGGLTLVAQGRGVVPTLNVTGCVSIVSSVSVQVTPKQLASMAKSGSKESQMIMESGCPIDKGAQLVATKVSSKTCRKVTSTSQTSSSPNTGRSQLTVLFNVNSSACNTWWIILVAVIGGIIVLGAIGIVIAYAVSPKLRSIINPFKGSNT